jgi:hypothetical protein
MLKWSHAFFRAWLISGSFSQAWKIGRHYITRDSKAARWLKQSIQALPHSHRQIHEHRHSHPRPDQH